MRREGGRERGDEEREGEIERGEELKARKRKGMMKSIPIPIKKMREGSEIQREQESPIRKRKVRPQLAARLETAFGRLLAVRGAAGLGRSNRAFKLYG